MLKQIKTMEDVISFATQLVKEGVNIHPDDDFNDYIHQETHQPIYTKADAEERNRLMSQCFVVCNDNNADIYDIMGEVVLNETGLDKFIPKPSANYTE